MKSNIKVFDFSGEKPQRKPLHVGKTKILKIKDAAPKPPRTKSPDDEYRSLVDKLARVEGKSPDEVRVIVEALHPGKFTKQLKSLEKYLGLIGDWKASTSVTLELTDYLTLMIHRRRVDLSPIKLDAMIKAITTIIEGYLK